MSEINADHYSNYPTACNATFTRKHCRNIIYCLGFCVAVQFGWRILRSTTA